MEEVEEGISIFKIYRANANYDSGTLKINLYYPRNPIELNSRLPGNSEFGAKTLDELLRTGSAEIATPENPIKPADGGSMYVFSDDVVLLHRRDKGAPLHKLYHGTPGGFTDKLNSTFSEQGLIQTGLRETAEEQILITKNKKNRIVRIGSEEDSYKTSKTLGIENLSALSIKMQFLPSKDELNVFWEDGEPIFSSKGKGWLDLMWDSSTSLSLMQVISVPFPSSEIYPIDTEGMVGKEGKFIHFNRESYLIPLSELANKRFGTPLKNFEVFQTRIENGIPQVYTPKIAEPFYGPDKKIVTNPHLWAPENHTTVCLDALGVPGFAGKRLDIQLWKEKCALSGESMIPKEFLIGELL